MHFGQPVLVEPEPLCLAQIPVTGDKLHESIFVHLRYAVGIPHKFITVRGFRRGRSVDILLDEPIEHDSQQYTILNVKGVGADADRDMVIHTSCYYRISQRWAGSLPRIGKWERLSDSRIWMSRVWGAVQENAARDEFKDNTFRVSGIPEIPYICFNSIPAIALARITSTENSESGIPLAQLYRLCNTNVRMDLQTLYPDVPQGKLWQDWGPHINISAIAIADARVINAQRFLAADNKYLMLDGDFLANRFIDGRFTDRENYSIRNLNHRSITVFLHDLITATLSFLHPDCHGEYFEILSSETDLPLDKENFTIILERTLGETTFVPLETV